MYFVMEVQSIYMLFHLSVFMSTTNCTPTICQLEALKHPLMCCSDTKSEVKVSI